MKRNSNSPYRPGANGDPLRRMLTLIVMVFLAACLPLVGPGEPTRTLPPPTPSVTPYTFPPTYTPTEPGPPTRTPTARATRTPQATSTLAPTAAPSPTPLVQILAATGDSMPVFNFDFTFFSDGRLKKWDREMRALVDLHAELKTISGFSFSADQSTVAVVVQEKDEPAVHILNLVTMEMEVSLLFLPGENVHQAALSPDGRWLAVLFQEAEAVGSGDDASPTPTTESVTATPTATQSPTSESNGGLNIALFEMSANRNRTDVGKCTDRCTGLIWSPLSDRVVWGDADGLWEIPVGTTPPGPVQILPPVISGLSGSAQTNDGYLPVAFAPSGEYLIVRKGLEQGSVFAVLDLSAGNLENLPGTGAYTGSGTDVIWLSGDRLLIARPGVARLNLLPGLEIWQVRSAGGESFFSPVANISLPGDVAALPAAPVELPAGRIGLTLVNMRDGNDASVNGLYLVDPGSGEWLRLNYLPLARAEELFFMPDLSAAILRTESRLLFVPADFGQIFSLASVFGSGACCFHLAP